MSTTADLEVAVRYSLSAKPVLLRLKVDSFIECGANISYLSAFPSEIEYLYPPLTYLKPVSGPPLSVVVGAYHVTVVDVVPHL
jgi:hypothetical protein